MDANAGTPFRVSWQTYERKRHCPEPTEAETVAYLFFNYKCLQLTISCIASTARPQPLLEQHLYHSNISTWVVLRENTYFTFYFIYFYKEHVEFSQRHMERFSKERGRYRMLY